MPDRRAGAVGPLFRTSPSDAPDSTIVSSMERITSRQNPVVRQFRALIDAGERRQANGEHILLDGAHLLEEALAADLPLDVVAIGDEPVEHTTGLGRRAAARGARLLSVSANVLAAISPVRQPSGVVAIARHRPSSIESVFAAGSPLVLLLSEVQDPGNVGAAIRAAEACGATGVITSPGSADPFGWKALRGAMGSSFRIPVAARQPLDAAVREAHRRAIRVYAAAPRGGTPLPRCDLRRSAAILLGGEGTGLSPNLMTLADEALTIPMRGGVESLNVATAAALIAYEALRQREAAQS
jgi:TrmH family RNA methyltransferase